MRDAVTIQDLEKIQDVMRAKGGKQAEKLAKELQEIIDARKPKERAPEPSKPAAKGKKPKKKGGAG